MIIHLHTQDGVYVVDEDVDIKCWLENNQGMPAVAAVRRYDGRPGFVFTRHIIAITEINDA